MLIFLLFSFSSVFAIKYYDLENAEVLFNTFLEDYKIKYRSNEEKTEKFDIFKENLRNINKVNSQHQYNVFGITKFADKSSNDMTGGYEDNRKPDNLDPCSLVDIKEEVTPEQFDWREKRKVLDVKDQGNCRSSWAFSATGAMESQMSIHHNITLYLSQKQLIDCDTEGGNQGCTHGYPNLAFDYIIRTGGIESSRIYDYDGDNNKCHFKKEYVALKLAACYSLSVADNVKKWQQALIQFGPLSIRLSGTTWHNYYQGIYDCPSGSVDMSALLVGYGSENGVPFWVIKSSWGRDWGENGYIRVKKTDNPCSMYDDEPKVPVLA